MISEEDLLELQKSFPPFVYPDTKPCRVKFRGSYIKTRSGKTVWRKVGFAKYAMLNHLEDSTYLPKHCYSGEGVFKRVKRGAVKELLRELERAGIVEYVEIDAEPQ